MNFLADLKVGMAGAAPSRIPHDFGLSALDWRVVALARTEADRFGSRAFRARGLIGRALDRLSGSDGGVRRLADDRLEALRRFVGLSRRSDSRAALAAERLSALGVGAHALELLRHAATR